MSGATISGKRGSGATLSGGTLGECLRLIRRRIFAVGGIAGLAGALAAAVVLLLAAAWLDLMWELSPALRISAWIIAGVFAAVVVVTVIWTLSRAVHDHAVARRMDRAAGTGGDILSGVDLDRGGEQSTPLSTGLAVLAVARAGNLAAGLSGSRVVSTKPARVSAGALVGLVAATTILAFFAPDLAYTQWLRFSDPFGDNPPFSRIKFTVEPGDTDVLYGSDLDVHVTTVGPPVERVELVLRSADGPAESLPMFPESGGKWRAALANVVQPAEYFVRADTSRSRKYSIRVITVPRIEKVEFRVVPPAYTGQAAYQGPLPKDGLSGLKGARVHIEATSNRPLSEGAIKVVAADKESTVILAPTGSAAEIVVGDFEITASGKFELDVVDVERQRSQDRFSGTITLLEDHRPFVRIVEPPTTSLATPTVTIPISISAEDDYGISRVQLFRSLNDSRPLPIDLPLPPGAGARVVLSDVLPLSAYGLSPGDVIKLFARVEDNDPAGAKGAESALATIQIISQADFERMLRIQRGMEMLLSKYRQAQRRLDALKREEEGLRKKLKESDPASKEIQEALSQLQQKMQQDASAMRSAAEAPMPYDVDQELSKQLEKLAQSLEQAAREAERLQKLAAEGKLSKEGLEKELKKIMQKLGGMEQEFAKEAIEPLKRLEEVFPLMAAESKFVQLYLRQRELEERLASLKDQEGEADPSTQARLRDYESEQRRIREDLGVLLDEIEASANRLPDDRELDELRASALEFADAVRASGADEAMTLAESALAEFSGKRAHPEAKRAADILESFISKCQGMGMSAGKCLGRLGPSMSQCLGNSVQQLLADMGLKPGSGLGSQPGGGQGNGGGYSARASTMDNMGLNGIPPTLGGMDGTGSRQSDRPGAATRAAGTSADEQDPTAAKAGRPLEAAGAGAASVPPRYRQRVIEYFQRIAEETAGD